MLYEDSQVVLAEVEAHMLGVARVEMPLVRSVWRHTGGTLIFIKRGLREFFRHGMKFYCWMLGMLAVCAVAGSLLPPEVRSVFGLLLPLLLIFVPVFFTAFCVPSTYSHGGVMIDDIKHACAAIADKGFGREVLDVLKSNIEKLEQPTKQRVIRLQFILGGAWAFWGYCFWSLLDPQRTISAARSDLTPLAVYSVALFIFFLLVQGYSRAYYVLYTTVYLAIDEHKEAVLMNSPEALPAKALKPSASSEHDGDLIEELALRQSLAGDGLQLGQPIKFDCGPRLKRLREDLELSISQFIELIGYPSEKWYRKAEEGRAEIEEAFLVKVAEATGTSLAWLKQGSSRMFETASINATRGDAFDRIKELNPSELYLLIDELSYGFYGVACVKPYVWVNLCFGVSLNFHTWWGDEHCIPEIRRFLESCFDEPRFRSSAYLVGGEIMSQGLDALNMHPRAVVKMLRRSPDVKSLAWHQLLADEDVTYDWRFDNAVLTNIREGFRQHGSRVSTSGHADY
jgi:transcriptional regulator with XRE-family HTH domain